MVVQFRRTLSVRADEKMTSLVIMPSGLKKDSQRVNSGRACIQGIFERAGLARYITVCLPFPRVGLFARSEQSRRGSDKFSTDRL